VRKPSIKPASIGFCGYPQPGDAYNLVWCGGFDIIDRPANQFVKKRKERLYHHFNPDKTAGRCGCPPGPSTIAVWNTAREVGNLGGRGSMKTDAGLIIAMRPLDSTNPEHRPYIAYENYRCLILRKNAKDLEDWFARGRRLYGKMGAEPVSSPSMKFIWPSGAEFILDHVQNADAYEKYQGQEFQTLIWEEVAHCPTLQLYHNVVRSLRCSDKRMRMKIYCTANAMGQGLQWVSEYFWGMKVCRKCGLAETVCQHPRRKGRECLRFDPAPVRRGEVWWDVNFPELTRTCVHSTIYDNPFLLVNDPAYVQSLERLEGTERKRWLLGDFGAVEGMAFDSFRPDGPQEGEPVCARHVIEVNERPLAPWWPRVVGMDIGFRHSAAMIKGCVTPDRKLVIYGEQAQPGIIAREWGVRLAHWLRPELEAEPDQVIECFVSHDAFASIGYEKTRAAMLEEGINEVLGQHNAFVIDQADNESAQEFFERYRAVAPAARIVLRKVPNYWKRIDGWDYIRELLRWWQMGAPNQELFSQSHLEQLRAEGDILKYAQYLKMFEPREPEDLPKLLIARDCPKVVKALRVAQFTDKKGSDQAAEDVMKTETESDDVIDACRHLALGFRFKVEHEPRDHWIQRNIQDLMSSRPDLNGSQLWHMKQQMQTRYGVEHPKVAAFSIRFGSPDHRGIRVQ